MAANQDVLSPGQVGSQKTEAARELHAPGATITVHSSNTEPEGGTSPAFDSALGMHEDTAANINIADTTVTESPVAASPMHAGRDGGSPAPTADAPPIYEAALVADHNRTPSPTVMAANAGDTVAQASCLDATPTPNEAARRLACFVGEVQQKSRSPLIKTPPGQRPQAKKKPMPLRSSRIAAQPLAQIPASKRGEALLMRRMGLLQATAPVSSPAQRAYDAIFSGNLTDSQVAAIPGRAIPGSQNKDWSSSSPACGQGQLGHDRRHDRSYNFQWITSQYYRGMFAA